MPGKVKATDVPLQVLVSQGPKTSVTLLLSTWSPPQAQPALACALAGTRSTLSTKCPALFIRTV